MELSDKEIKQLEFDAYKEEQEQEQAQEQEEVEKYRRMNFSERIVHDAKKHAPKYLEGAKISMNEDIYAYGTARISDEDVLEIIELMLEIASLKKWYDITEKTFAKKEASYHSIYKKIKDDYGIDHGDARKFPFHNPADLKTRIDVILMQSNLTQKQRSVFWEKIFKFKNAPNKKKASAVIKDIELFSNDQNFQSFIENSISEHPEWLQS